MNETSKLTDLLTRTMQAWKEEHLVLHNLLQVLTTQPPPPDLTDHIIRAVTSHNVAETLRRTLAKDIKKN